MIVVKVLLLVRTLGLVEVLWQQLVFELLGFMVLPFSCCWWLAMAATSGCLWLACCYLPHFYLGWPLAYWLLLNLWKLKWLGEFIFDCQLPASSEHSLWLAPWALLSCSNRHPSPRTRWNHLCHALLRITFPCPPISSLAPFLTPLAALPFSSSLRFP